jgi:hypothetical protein
MVFNPKGWISIVDVRRRIFSSLTFWDSALGDSALGDVTPFDLPDDELVGSQNAFSNRWHELEVEANRITWGILESLDKVAVLSSSGAIIAADLRLLGADFGEEWRTNYTTDLEIGTLGTGLLYEISTTELTQCEFLNQRFGPFKYCPIMVEQRVLEPKMAEAEAKIRSKNGEADEPYMSEVKIRDSIVTAFRDGKRLTKADYKKLLGPNLKHEAFRVIWKDAVAMVPELSRPGPKPY